MYIYRSFQFGRNKKHNPYSWRGECLCCGYECWDRTKEKIMQIIDTHCNQTGCKKPIKLFLLQ